MVTKKKMEAQVEPEKDTRYALTGVDSGPTRSVTLSLNRWRLAHKRLEREIRDVKWAIEYDGKGISLNQMPVASMYEKIRQRIREYQTALRKHRRLLAFRWLLRNRVAAKNQELGINGLLCEQEVTKMRLEVLHGQAMENRNEFRVEIEEIPELFQGMLEGERKITGQEVPGKANHGEFDVGFDEELDMFNRNVQENWKSRAAATSLTVETLPVEERQRLQEEFRALSRRMVQIGDEIAEGNQARLTLEVPVEVADAIQL